MSPLVALCSIVINLSNSGVSLLNSPYLSVREMKVVIIVMIIHQVGLHEVLHLN